MANIGILKELENNENRVALNEHAVEKLVLNTQSKVFICSGAGEASDISDQKYKLSGATILGTNKEVIEKSDIIMKIGRPSEKELSFFKEGQVLFAFLNLISNPDYAIKLSKQKITAIGYESIYDEANDTYPILAPVSKLVGKMCYSIGSNLLSASGSKGIFLGGAPNAKRSKVVIFGGGNAGQELMKLADSAGSRVVIFETDLDLNDKITTERPHVETMYPYPNLIKKELKNADLVVGAIFKGKSKVQKLITKQMIKEMEPKSVFIDLSYECGGISETTQFNPKINTFIRNRYNIIHYWMPNIASLIPSTSTSALSTPILKYLISYLITIHKNINNDILENAININNGKIADWIHIDAEQEDEEYKEQIKKIITEDNDYNLFDMIEDSESNDFDNNVFEETTEDDFFEFEDEEENNEEKDIDENDDPFGVDFKDIDI